MLFRKMFEDESFEVTPKQAEEIQDDFYVTKFLIGGFNGFKREWKDLKEDIEKEYSSVQDWIDEKPKFHKLIATRKSFYDKKFSVSGKEPKTFIELYRYYRSFRKTTIFFFFLNNFLDKQKKLFPILIT